MTRNYHTIKSGIVRDALIQIVQNPLSDSYIGGGLSLQFTLPEDLHRKTCDIDLTTSAQTSVQDFRDYVRETFAELVKRGYDISISKKRSTIDGVLERDGDRLLVQLPRRSKNNFENRKHILEREVEHTRHLEYGECGLNVIAYEDLIAHKAIRSTTFIDNYNLTKPHLAGLEEVKGRINSLKEQFEETSYSLTPQEAARQIASIRLTADVFDTLAVFEHFEDQFDEKYLQEALSSFDDDSDKLCKWMTFIDSLR
ncbi:MAG: nucleotidyl transferase AbiEii/AbiGii toxin family protein [Nanoarchaeota archaeon]|nr:nucleotidyl transferase AbiEii/AbiGii toxin family protein [Nanoarchaeota archaeon]